MAVTGRVSSTGNQVKGYITPRKDLQVTNFKINPLTIRIGDLFDIDATELGDGAVLTYDEATKKWKMTQEVSNFNTIINGGHF